MNQLCKCTYICAIPHRNQEIFSKVKGHGIVWARSHLPQIVLSNIPSLGGSRLARNAYAGCTCLIRCGDTRAGPTLGSPTVNFFEPPPPRGPRAPECILSKLYGFGSLVVFRKSVCATAQPNKPVSILFCEMDRIRDR